MPVMMKLPGQPEVMQWECVKRYLIYCEAYERASRFDSDRAGHYAEMRHFWFIAACYGVDQARREL